MSSQEEEKLMSNESEHQTYYLVDYVYIFTYVVCIPLFVVAGLYSGTLETVTLAVGLTVLMFLPCFAELVKSYLCGAGTSLSGATSHERLPIVYHPEYNISACGLENLHPFDSKKYGRVFGKLVDHGIINENQIYAPTEPTLEELLLVHSRRYLAFLHSAFYLTTVLEVPFICCLPSFLLRRRVLRPMLLATGGTMLAGRIALEKGFCINLGGGYHHASGTRGSGFCVYADISLSIQHLRKDFPHQVKKAMIIDLDAHQGNGHERDFIGDADTFIIDVYNRGIFPGDGYARRAIRIDIGVSAVHSDDDYIALIKGRISDSIEQFEPDVIFYNAGTDCMINDPLGGLCLSSKGIMRRDEIVFRSALHRPRPVPIVMVLSGGYQMANAQCIYESIVNLNEQLNLFTQNTVR